MNRDKTLRFMTKAIAVQTFASLPRAVYANKHKRGRNSDTDISESCEFLPESHRFIWEKEIFGDQKYIFKSTVAIGSLEGGRDGQPYIELLQLEEGRHNHTLVEFREEEVKIRIEQYAGQLFLQFNYSLPKNATTSNAVLKSAGICPNGTNTYASWKKDNSLPTDNFMQWIKEGIQQRDCGQGVQFTRDGALVRITTGISTEDAKEYVFPIELDTNAFMKDYLARICAPLDFNYA